MTNKRAAPHVVLMGVAGSGKTTLGEALAQAIGAQFYDGDDFHSPANVEKMMAGTPLNDSDRQDWLTKLRQLLDEKRSEGQPVVLACSALKERYRHSLGLAEGGFLLVYLAATPSLVERRLAERGAHYMPSSLIPSQFEALEEPATSIKLDAAKPVVELVTQVVIELGKLNPQAATNLYSLD